MAKWSQALEEIRQAAATTRDAAEETAGEVSEAVRERVRTGTDRIDTVVQRMLEALRNDPDDIADPPA